MMKRTALLLPALCVLTSALLDMPDVNHTFRRGHRIMVQVQSSWFPLVVLNPQAFVSIPSAAPADFRKATERVHRSRSAASGVRVHVLNEAAAGRTRSVE